MAIKIKNKDNGRPEESEGGEQPEAPAGGGTSGGELDGLGRVTFMAAAWIEDNRSLFFTMVGVTALAALGVILGVYFVRGQQVEASDLLSDGLAAYEVPEEGSPELEMFESQDLPAPPKVYESGEEKWQAVYDSAEETLVDYDGGPIAISAQMTKAAAALNLEKYEEASELYQQVVDTGDEAGEFEAYAHMGLANSLAAQGELDEAEDAWERFAELNPDRASYADFETARMVERYGDADSAEEHYEQFLEDHPESQYLDEVERRMALL